MTPGTPLCLLETLAVDDGIPRHLGRHLARLASSARTLGFAGTPTTWEHRAVAAASGLPGLQRMRLVLSRDGTLDVQISPSAPLPRLLHIAVAPTPVDTTHPLIRHKTTQRDHLLRHAVAGVDDTLLHTSTGFLTEFTYGNVVLEIEGAWLTPPSTAGLLPGIERQRALDAGTVREAPLRLSDLHTASRIWHLNSMRGWTLTQLAT